MARRVRRAVGQGGRQAARRSTPRPPPTAQVARPAALPEHATRAAASGGAPRWAVMAITLITGPANAGKAQVVLDAVRAQRRTGASRC